MCRSFFLIQLFVALDLFISASSSPLNLDTPSGIKSKAVADNQLQRRTSSNPIYECWSSDPSWRNDRQHLADCSIGFGKSAIGGKGGQCYKVIDPSDNDLINPKPGTLRHALIQGKPLWITFSGRMKIKLSGLLYVSSFKTIDGRGGNVRISGKGCLLLEDVTNVIIHGVVISHCVPTDSSYIKKNESRLKHAGESSGNGITIIRCKNIWVDNCTISDCLHGLIELTLSTDLTFSNNLYFNKSELLLDRQDNNNLKQVTTLYNRFGKHGTKIPPSRNNGGSASNGDGGTTIYFWYLKQNNAVKVAVAFAVTIVIGGGGYVIYRMCNNCGNDNNCFICCNGNRK